MREILRHLPRGWTLTEQSWRARHRAILCVLWAHVVLVSLFGLSRGFGIAHLLLEAGAIGLLAVAASFPSITRKGRTIAASVGLMTASAVLVHLSSGSIEMHFHFFVMVPLVAVYQDWVPFSVAITYVVLHHGVAGSIDPYSVFNHPAAIASPWKWAGVHALFISAISIICLITWRLLEAALQNAKAEAQVKSEFLSVLSHEIRTPLTAVIGYTGLLADGDLSSEQREHANTIRRSSDHLLTLINDILDYSKLEAGRLELDDEPFDVVRLVDDTVALVAETAHRRKVRLTTLCDGSVPRTVIGDSGRVSQVVLNLASNAVKFTEDGDVRVLVAARAMSSGRHELTITVRDTGIGIEPETLRHLLKPFTQAEASTSRRYGGSGLGLAIASQLCDLMGGEIRVESMPGVGSTFRASFVVRDASEQAHRADSPQLQIDIVGEPDECLLEYLSERGIAPRRVTAVETLVSARAGGCPDVIFITPSVEVERSELALELRDLFAPNVVQIVLLCRPQSKRPAEGAFDVVLGDPPRQSDVDDVLDSVSLDHRPAVERREPTSSHAPDVSPLRLLVAEDNHVNQKVLLSQLRRLGYEADAVASGVEAVDASAVRDYDVILMDVHMPEMDGLDAARLIRERSNGRCPAIIAVSADATPEAKAECRVAGMQTYIAKPVNIGELSTALQKVAGYRQAARH